MDSLFCWFMWQNTIMCNMWNSYKMLIVNLPSQHDFRTKRLGGLRCVLMHIQQWGPYAHTSPLFDGQEERLSTPPQRRSVMMRRFGLGWTLQLSLGHNPDCLSVIQILRYIFCVSIQDQHQFFPNECTWLSFPICTCFLKKNAAKNPMNPGYCTPKTCHYRHIPDIKEPLKVRPS